MLVQGDSVEEVVERLKADNSPWAQDCLARMARMSPLRYPPHATHQWKSRERGEEEEMCNHAAGSSSHSESAQRRARLLEPAGRSRNFVNVSSPCVCSLKLVWRQLEEGDQNEFDDALRAEHRVATRLLHNPGTTYTYIHKLVSLPLFIKGLRPCEFLTPLESR
jgi:hypothetical protein